MSDAQDRVRAMFEPLVDLRIEGGCEHCDAYQVVEPDPTHDGVWHLNVYHDDSCPWLRSRGLT